MARATWSGNISFGLVTVPVKLYTAVRSHDIGFHQLHEETKARVRRRKVDAQTGEEVDSDDIVKGYDVGGGEYLVVDPDELGALDPEATRTIDIRDFVELADIDPIYFDRPYYLAPDGDAARRPYALLVQAMQASGKAAVATFVMRTNEYLAAIRPRDGVLVLNTMNYADEVVDSDEVDVPDLSDMDVGDRELDMARQLIDSLSTDFDPGAYHDEYHERVREFLEAKATGEDVTVAPAEEERGEVIDLMSALEQSLSAGQGSDVGGGDDLEERSKDELYDLAQDRDIPGRSDMTKDELITALRHRGGRVAAG